MIYYNGISLRLHETCHSIVLSRLYNGISPRHRSIQKKYSCPTKKKKSVFWGGWLHSVLLKGEFLSSDNDDDDSDVEVIIPVWTAYSLQKKCSKFVLPLVTKFICLTNRHPKKAVKVRLFCFLLLFFCYHVLTIVHFVIDHSDNDHYYNRIHSIFLEQNPNITSFDIYWPSWKYLKDCTTFLSIMKALQTNPSIRDKKKRADNPAAVQLFSPEGTSGTDDAAVGKNPCPSGSKASKRRVEEEKLLTM
jgi:hypothetical protein